MKISGIYKIVNKINGKLYVGSAMDIKNRWCCHRRDLYENKHHSILLQRSWNKYGKDNFIFEIIEECEEFLLVEREQYWINETKCYEREIGYNICKIARSQLGQKRTNETKQLLRELQLGKHHSEESKQKCREASLGENNGMYGKHHSQETKQKISKMKNGKCLSKETRLKMSRSQKGKPKSEEHKKNISEAKRGEKCYNAKLTWEIVREIREKYVPRKYTLEMLAKEYKVSMQNISKIIKNIRWIEETISNV